MVSYAHISFKDCTFLISPSDTSIMTFSVWKSSIKFYVRTQRATKSQSLMAHKLWAGCILIRKVTFKCGNLGQLAGGQFASGHLAGRQNLAGGFFAGRITGRWLFFVNVVQILCILYFVWIKVKTIFEKSPASCAAKCGDPFEIWMSPACVQGLPKFLNGWYEYFKNRLLCLSSQKEKKTVAKKVIFEMTLFYIHVFLFSD